MSRRFSPSLEFFSVSGSKFTLYLLNIFCLFFTTKVMFEIFLSWVSQFYFHLNIIKRLVKGNILSVFIIFSLCSFCQADDCFQIEVNDAVSLTTVQRKSNIFISTKHYIIII